MMESFPKSDRVGAAALSETAQAELSRLKELSLRAQAGDSLARKELREALAKTDPQLLEEATNFTRLGQKMIINTFASSDHLMKEALPLRLEAMERELAGADCSGLEKLLSARVVSLWFTSEVLDACANAQLQPGIEHASPKSMKQLFAWQESTSKRFIAALKELRRLQSGLPESMTQVNQTQINLGRVGGGSTSEPAIEEEPD